MKRPTFFSLLTALCLTGSLTAHAEKLDEWFKILPKNTVGVIAIKNTPELLADWEKSSFTKLMADEEFKKWTAPMIKEGETPWDKTFKESHGEGLYDSLKHYPGASIAVFRGDSPEDFSGDEPPICGLSDAAGQEKALEDMKAREIELAIKKDESLKQRTVEVEGITVHILSNSDDADEGWEDGYAFVDGTLVEGSSLEDMTYFITALKSGAGESSAVVADHMGRIAQLTEGHTDLLIYINGETLVQWGVAAANAAAQNSAQSMPIAPDAIIDALGANEIQALALTVDFTDSQSRMDFALLHPAKPTGFVSLLRGTNSEVILPAFIPADVLSGSVTRYSMVDLWDKLMTMINKLGPMAVMATMQLGGIEAQLGVKLRDDFFASLDDEYIEITDGSLEKQSQVLAFKVKDHPRLGGALDGIQRFVGAGFAAFEESEFLGYKINQIKAMNAQPDAAEMAFCLTDDYLLFSTGPQALLKKVLARMKEPSGPSIWDNDRAQDLLARLPAGYSGAGISDGGKVMKVLTDAMTLVQNQAAKSSKKKTKGKKSKGPDITGGLQDAGNTAETWFDPAAVPSDTMWERYFGTSSSGIYNPADAIHYRTVTTPVEAQ